MAAAVPAAAAAAPGPLADVRICLGICGLGANVDRFITCHALTSMDDFEFMEPDDVGDITKMYNDRHRNAAQKIGFPVQKKISGFLYWYHDKIRRQEAIVAADFNVAAMKQAIKDCAADSSEKDTDVVDIEVGKIEVEMGWWDWKEKLTSKLESRKGVNGTPLAYVIRQDKPAGWTVAQATSPIEKLMYQVPLTGTNFVKDNSTVWAELQSHCLGTSTYEWIRQFDASKNGRAGFQALVTMCEGQAHSNKRILLSNRILSLDHNKGGCFYRHEYTYSFEKYCTNLHKAYMTIECYRNKTAPETMV